MTAPQNSTRGSSVGPLAACANDAREIAHIASAISGTLQGGERRAFPEGSRDKIWKQCTTLAGWSSEPLVYKPDV